MDIGEIGELSDQYDHNGYDINYVKGGMKGGKGGKSLGGKGMGLCTNCWQPGHHRSECTNPVVCNYCWEPGHMRSECPALKGQGKASTSSSKGQQKGVYKGFSSKGKSKGYKGKGVYEVEQ